MNDDEPSIVGKMMDFLYTLDYDDRPSSSMAEAANLKASLLVNTKVYNIADKYELEALKEFACTKYQQVLSNTWNGPVFLESACHVLENTMEANRMLRDVVVQVASDHARELLIHDEFFKMLKNHPDISWEVLRNVPIGAS